MRVLYVCLSVVLLSVLVGCATYGGLMGDPTESNYHGEVNGVISVPPSASVEALCANIRVTGMANGAPIGQSSVHPSARGRCHYAVTHLPPSQPISITVTPGPVWACDNGQPVAMEPPVKTVTLKDYETKVEDFRTYCTGAAVRG